MTPYVTAMYRSDALRALAALALAATATPALARGQDQPASSREPDAQDVAMTPLNDLNLSKDAIPPVLLAASSDPYASTGLTRCSAIQAAIGELDAVLGPDMDVSVTDADRLSTGRVAKSVVASFIPFRGVLRELSGAAGHERAYEAAIYAGSVRRGFLKGLGQQKGCDYPARPAYTRVAAPMPAAVPAAQSAKKRKQGKTPADPGFVSEPVVQPLPGQATSRR